VVVFNTAPVEQGLVPAFGWRTFSLDAGVATQVSVAATGATISTGAMVATLGNADGGWALDSLKANGVEALGGSSLEWVRYTDSGGLYRIGAETPECASAKFSPDVRLRAQALEVIEGGVKLTATLDGKPLVLELTGNSDRLRVKATGSSARGTTTVLRIAVAEPGESVRMGVAGGSVGRPLSRGFDPTFWPAVRYAAHGRAVLSLGFSTGVHATASGALEWIAFRNANDEKPCTSLGAEGTDDSVTTEVVELGIAGEDEIARSIALSRPLIRVLQPAHGGDLASTGRLITIEGAVATAIKPAERGDGLIVHLLGKGTLTPGALPWTSSSPVDWLERDAEAGTAVRLR
jgi:hypothetical protein